MSSNTADIAKLAAAYTAAWNTGLPQKVAEFFTEDGEIVINRGTPWRGRAGVAEMAAGFFADVRGMKLVCDGESNTCQLTCQSNVERPGGYACYDASGDGNSYCVNPTCTAN